MTREEGAVIENNRRKPALCYCGGGLGECQFKGHKAQKRDTSRLWKGKTGDRPKDEAGVDYQSSNNHNEKIGLGLDV